MFAIARELADAVGFDARKERQADLEPEETPAEAADEPIRSLTEIAR